MRHFDVSSHVHTHVRNNFKIIYKIITEIIYKTIYRITAVNMASFNQATIVGFVGDEPRIIQTQKSNTAMASFAIATTERGFQRQDGTRVEDRTEWHNIVFFGKPAEIIGRYVHKGSSLLVQGKLRTRSYDDKKDGIKRYVTEIIGDNFQLLDKKQTDGVQSNNSVSSTSMNNVSGYQAPQDDDLPF